MAKFGVFRNGSIIVNGYDLSQHCEMFEVNLGQDNIPFHAHGDTTNYGTPGLFNWTVTATFFQDFAGGAVNECLANMLLNKTSAPIVCRPNQAAISATNPAWSGSGFIQSFRPMGGAHGSEALKCVVTFAGAGNVTQISS